MRSKGQKTISYYLKNNLVVLTPNVFTNSFVRVSCFSIPKQEFIPSSLSLHLLLGLVSEYKSSVGFVMVWFPCLGYCVDKYFWSWERDRLGPVLLKEFYYCFKLSTRRGSHTHLKSMFFSWQVPVGVLVARYSEQDGTRPHVCSGRETASEKSTTGSRHGDIFSPVMSRYVLMPFSIKTTTTTNKQTNKKQQKKNTKNPVFSFF